MAGPVYVRARQLMEAELGDELVTLDPAAGKCFGFNDAATWVWKRLAEPRSFEELRDGLLSEYDVSDPECTNDLRDLLDDLIAKRLIASR